ncbi:IPT/TIG domain-containing protein [Hymenobacter coccineus]|uniref:IPT/TIG domain-containing protein n=1 Tax=Hymenobacter coccineus TaxID=1908235 RepID=UPI001300D8D6|nr:IPT/TIG domain-containing protein [Hymenobacter coccineus]
MPTSVSGTNRILTASGNNSYELGMTRSADGRYLVLTGYSAAPGTTGVAASAATDITRVIALIAADGTVDTSTSTGTAFSGSSIRTAATVNGTSFYSVGGNSGVQYQAFGSAMTTQLNTAPINIRSINVANGGLYISTNSAAYFGLNQVGNGLATTGGQAVTVLPGFPGATAGSSPNGFYFADLSDAVPGVDVVYVADDRSTSGGIQKWSLVAGSWVLNGTIAGSASTAVRGLNGLTRGTAVALAATSANGLFSLTDNTGYNAAPTLIALPTAIAGARANTAFRGMAFAPMAASPTIASFTPGSGPVGTTVTVTGANFSGASVLLMNGVGVSAFTVIDAATITFTVPADATSGLLAVTTPGGTATSASPFAVMVPVVAPTIASFTPTAGGPGTTVTITGTNFTGATAVSIGSLAVPAYTVVSATTITLVLPSSAANASGPLTVVTPGGTATSTASFNLTLAAVASQALPGLALFPNPAIDYVVVKLPKAGAATAALRDLMGRLVLAPVALGPQQPLYLPAGLGPGVYLLEVRQGSETAVRRLVKQ